MMGRFGWWVLAARDGHGTVWSAGRPTVCMRKALHTAPVPWPRTLPSYPP